MPTDPQAFQQARKPWSRWKHQILDSYLPAMATILQSRKTIYYVDGFAGPGRYTEDDTEGSPLLAARHAERLASSNSSYELKCLNVEADSEVFQNLQASTSDFDQFVHNYNGDFADFIENILKKIADRPALFFLDPIGVKELAWSTLEPLFKRTELTELLVRFDAQTALRLTGKGEHLHKTFNAILGENDSQYWKERLRQCGQSPAKKRDCLTQAYEEKIKSYFEYVTRIPIKDSDNRIKYYLLFATRNLKGVQLMNDVLVAMNDLRDRTLDEERQKHNRLQQQDMFASSTQDLMFAELNLLKELVQTVLRDCQPIRRDDLRANVALIDDSFGRFSGSQITAVLGGRARKIEIPSGFVNLKSRIRIVNNSTLGSDKAKLKLVD